MTKYGVIIGLATLFFSGGRPLLCMDLDNVCEGTVSAFTERLAKITLRLKGIVLASQVQRGMTRTTVLEILGTPDLAYGGFDHKWLVYIDFGIQVKMEVAKNTKGGSEFLVSSIKFDR